MYTEGQVRTLKKKIDEDFDFTPTNVQNKILELPKLYSKYKALYLKQRKILKNINTAIKTTREKLLKYIKFGDYEYHLERASDIEDAIQAQPEMQELMDAKDDQEAIVEWLKEVYTNTTKMSYQLRNYIELMKLRNGVIQ